MPEEKGHFSVSMADGICFAEFEDRKILDEVVINEIGDQLSTVVEEHRPINLILNFGNVQHLSSAALGMLITLQKKTSGEGGQLKLTDIDPQIFEVFKITKLHKVFDIHDTAAAARASFMGGK